MSQSVAPDVSIVIACYDAAATWPATLASLKAQTHENWEALCVDDGSTDSTCELLHAAARADQRIRVIAAPHGGVSAARNRGVRAARANRILFLDPDDLAWPDALALLLQAARTLPDGTLVTAGFELLADDGRPLDCPRIPATLDSSVEAFIRSNRLQPNALVPTALLGQYPFDESLPACEDWDLWLRLAHGGAPFVTLPRVLFGYRLRAGSLSHRADLLFCSGRRVIERWQGRAPDPQRTRDAVHLLALRCGALALATGSRDRVERYFASLTPLEPTDDFPLAAASGLAWAFQSAHGVVGRTWRTHATDWLSEIGTWLNEGPVARHARDILPQLCALTRDPQLGLDAAVNLVEARAARRLVVYGLGTNGLPLLEKLRRHPHLRGVDLCVADDYAGPLTFSTLGLPRTDPRRWSTWPTATVVLVTATNAAAMLATLARAGGRVAVDFTTWADTPVPAPCAGG